MPQFIFNICVVVCLVFFLFVDETKAGDVADRAEVVRIAHAIADKHQANLGRILTWRGRAEEDYEEVHFDGEQKTTERFNYVKHFIADLTTGNCFVRTECIDRYKIHADGRKELLVRQSVAAFLKDNVYHEFYTHQRPPGDNGNPFYRKINIGNSVSSSELFFTLFRPEYKAIPYPTFHSPAVYQSYWRSFKLNPDPRGGESKMRREGDIVTHSSVFQDIVSFRSVDLSKGGTLLDFRHTIDNSKTGGFCQDLIWHCEMQQIDGIWVPSYTEWTWNDISMKRILKWTTRWKEQKLNEPVRDDEMTLRTLGARQTDLVEDHRTGELYNIKGDEYPPSLEEQALIDFIAESDKTKNSKLIRIALGILFLLAAGIMLYYLQQRQKKNEYEKK